MQVIAEVVFFWSSWQAVCENDKLLHDAQKAYAQIKYFKVFSCLNSLLNC